MRYQVIRVNINGRQTLENEFKEKQDAINYIHSRYHMAWHFYEIGSYSDDMWILRELA